MNNSTYIIKPENIKYFQEAYDKLIREDPIYKDIADAFAEQYKKDSNIITTQGADLIGNTKFAFNGIINTNIKIGDTNES